MMPATIFDTLRVLFAEQTTADEVIVFLIICVVLALLVAFLLYALILAALWRGRLRGVTTLQALLFPRRQQVVRYLGEYLLAAATSVLLTLTIAARHQAVEFVLDYPLYEVDAADIQHAFPFGGVEIEELIGTDDSPSELATSLAAIATGTAPDGGATGLPSIGVEALLLPTVAAGGADNAILWLRAVVDRLEESPWRQFPNERHLLTLAIFLLLAYVGWFAFGRSRTVEKAGGAAETDYARIVGRLLLPAVCVALLLVSAAGAADPQRLTRSAVAAAGLGLDSNENEAAGYFAAAMNQQIMRGQLVRYLVADGDSVPGALSAIQRLDTDLRAVRSVTSDLAAIDAEARRQLVGEWRRTNDRIARDSALLAGELTQVAGRTQELAGSIRQARELIGEMEEAVTGARGRADAAVAQAREAERSAAALETGLRELAARIPSSGLLLVVTSPQTAYQVRAGGAQGAVRASGVGVGLHALPPGAYSVTSNLGTSSRTISTGSAETVRLERVVSSTPPAAAPQSVQAQRALEPR